MRKILYLSLLSLAGMQAACADSALRDTKDNRPRDLAPLKNHITIINLWASWCAPCREEMPELSAFARAQQKIRRTRPLTVLGIAFDSADNVKTFLKTTPVTYPVWRYDGNDSTALMASLGNQAGALPYTVIDAPACAFRQAFYGKVTRSQLNTAVAAAEKACAKP